MTDTSIELITDEDRAAYWKGAYERMAARNARMVGALEECEEYFDNRADADCDETGFVGNPEMRLLCSVRDAMRDGVR